MRPFGAVSLPISAAQPAIAPAPAVPPSASVLECGPHRPQAWPRRRHEKIRMTLIHRRDPARNMARFYALALRGRQTMPINVNLEDRPQ